MNPRAPHVGAGSHPARRAVKVPPRRKYATVLPIAIDYALDGIRCNCVCPGDMETPMIEQYFAGTDDASAARSEMEAAYPGRRIADPSEVATAVTFLASDESSFVNGTPDPETAA